MSRSRLLALVLVGACAPAAQPPSPVEPTPAMIAHARDVHARVLTLDTHVDIDAGHFTSGSPNYADSLGTQVNLPKMEAGGLDAVFFSIYVGQGPQTDAGYAAALAVQMEKFDAVQRLATELAPGRIAIARTADDVQRIVATGRKAALMGVENAYGIGTDIANVRRFHERGARYMSLSHNGHSQLSDSNTGERDGVWQWNGLSPLGRAAIAEMNRLGMMVDISHPSKAANMQAMALTRAPVIASHSAVRALCDHSRNLDDEQLRALARTGGVVQIVAFNNYLRTPPPPSAERVAAIAALRAEFGLAEGQGGLGGLSAERRAAFQARMGEVNRRFPPPPRATVRDLVDHIDYAVKLIGIDHVGISSDFDGGGGVQGWSDATETPNVTIELVRRGYTEDQIAKLWSGNLLRVMRDVERAATLAAQ
ncbi:MAG TPA: dipeptidase [Gemmatimonadaceae bacterium]|nr:dipeptidase [Gemmatimonadaceae bacterium]